MNLNMSPNVWKVKFYREGFCIGSIWRGRGGIRHRARINSAKTDKVLIFMCNGKVLNGNLIPGGRP